MTKVLVLYYSSFGHIERMAEAEAEGARFAGAHVDIKRVPELVPRMQAHVTSSTKSPQLLMSRIFSTTTRSSLAPQRDMATWPRK
jgi:hypothetical protein